LDEPRFGAIDEAIIKQVERIARSDAFVHSEALRRLLRFLAQKSMSGEADQLKEYTIGLEAYGKPPSYDPKHDATVRLYAARLRQKLGEYYNTEGIDDPIVLTLPKGHFKLIAESRRIAPSAGSAVASKLESGIARNSQVKSSQVRTMLLGFALLLSLTWGAFNSIQWSRARAHEVHVPIVLTPELDKLWHPFIATNRPLILAIEDPLFVEFKGTDTAYRDKSLNQWSEVAASPKVAAIRKALNNIEIVPRYYYTDLGEATASFMFGRLLSPYQPNISLSRSSAVTWQQLADNNVLFVGAPWLFVQIAGMSVSLEFKHDHSGIHIVHPKGGEPSLLVDDLPTSAAEDGEVYALITHVPGPLGYGDVETVKGGAKVSHCGGVKGNH
jgi:hypothetical protein